MKDFEEILEVCLNDLEQGGSVDECLARHPEYVSELKPLLQASMHLERGREIRPPVAFRARTRAKLTRHMQDHPRAKQRGLSIFEKLTISFAALVCAFLIAGTAYAQDALPGSSFYTWKFASERVWRSVTLDPVSTDITLLDRRAIEWIAVSKDPELSNKASQSYREAENILQSAANEDPKLRILPALEQNQKLLKESGISFPAQNDSFDLGSPDLNNESGGREVDITTPISPPSTAVP